MFYVQRQEKGSHCFVSVIDLIINIPVSFLSNFKEVLKLLVFSFSVSCTIGSGEG